MRVSPHTTPEWVTQLAVLIDHHMLYVGGSEFPEGWVEERVTAEAVSGDVHAAARWGLFAVQVPMQTYVDAPVVLEEWDSEPPADDGKWDQVVEADLPIPGKRIYMWGGGGTEAVSFELDRGLYRARVAGRGYGVSVPSEAKGEFRVQVWPWTDGNLRLIKQWPVW